MKNINFLIFSFAWFKKSEQKYKKEMWYEKRIDGIEPNFSNRITLCFSDNRIWKTRGWESFFIKKQQKVCIERELYYLGNEKSE